MRWTEQLEKNVISVISSDHLKRGTAGMILLQPVLLDFFFFSFFFFQKDLVTHSRSLREEVGYQTPQR